MTDTIIQKAVIYCRVSDSKQKTEGHGLESQETRCREFADYKDYTVVQAFHDDISGKVAGRPAMMAMLNFLKKQKEPYAVIIDDISRLARNLEAHIQLRTAISAAGGVLQSPSIEFGEDADSQLVENLLASVSQHHRQKNADQTRNRMRSRAMGGYWCFPAPLGYKFVKDSTHGKFLVRNEPIASVIQEALEGFASGRFQTQSEVMRFFADCPEYPETQRKRLTVERVYEILTRPLYAAHITIPQWKLHLVPARHEGLISFDTFQTIQRRIKEAARVPARKDLNQDFPLRQFILCGCCAKPLMGCWSTGRNRRHAYYLCQRKGCDEYGKSIRRDVVEGQFEALLRDMKPTVELFDLAHAMFRDLWNGRIDSATTRAQALKIEMQKVDRTIGQILDRVVEADSTTIIKAYENRIRTLEEEKTALREKIANCGRPLADFDTSFRTAMEFLANPHKLWLSDRLEDKRAVLKLTFADRLSYTRNEGFRTVLTSSPFRLLSHMKGEEVQMVRVVGIERTLLAEPDFEVNRGFHRIEIPRLAPIRTRAKGSTDAPCPLRPPVRFTRYSPILPHTFTRGLQSGGSIAFYLHKSKEVEIRYERCPTCRPKNNSPAAVTRDCAACRQHDLRHGAARRIPAALLSHLTLRRLGLGRGRSLARRSAPCLSRKCHQTCSKP